MLEKGQVWHWVELLCDVQPRNNFTQLQGKKHHTQGKSYRRTQTHKKNPGIWFELSRAPLSIHKGGESQNESLWL